MDRNHIWWTAADPSVLLMSCCCLGLYWNQSSTGSNGGDCEVQRDQNYYCSKGVFLIYNEEGLILNREFQWMEPPKWENGSWLERSRQGLEHDFSRLDCLPDQDAFHVLDRPTPPEVIFRYEGSYKVIED